MREKREKGITLIALVVTIIVLLILAGVSIQMLTGQNGILARAKETKEKTEIANYKEQMEEILLELKADSIIGESDEEFLTRLGEELKKIGGVKTVTSTEDESGFDVETEEGYNFRVTEDGVEYIGKNGIPENPDDTETNNKEQTGDVTVSYDKLNWRKSKEITLEASGQEIEYALGEEESKQESWKSYSNKIIVDKNNIMLYARIKGNTDKKKETREVITNIDKEAPTKLTLEEIKNEGETYEIKVTSKDKEKTEESGMSGIKKFVFSYSTNGESGPFTTPSDGTKEVEPKATAEIIYLFTGLNKKIEYTIKVEAYDQAENKIEEIVTVDKKGNGIGAEEVINNLKTYMGKYVKYGVDLDGDGNYSNDWKIFYAKKVENESRIYLIADDYVPTAPENNETLKNIMTTSMSNANMTKSTSSGFEKFGTSWKNMSSLETLTTPMNWKELFMHTKHTLSSNDGSKWTSTLLKTSNWSGFIPTKEKNTDGIDWTKYADYVIGGPTVEMWCAAWNVNMPMTGKDENGFLRITAEITNTNGYYVSTSELEKATNSLYVNGNIFGGEKLTATQLQILQDKYSLFFPHTNDNINNNVEANNVTGICSGYWLASSFAVYSNSVMNIWCTGSVGYDGYGDCSIRPLICLKPEIVLEEQESITVDGEKTYSIVN